MTFDYEAIGATLGILGFLLSLTLAYYAHFRDARIEILSGNRIQFYPAPSRTLTGPEFLGGMGFYLPLTVHNWSARGGVLYKVRLLIQHADSNLCFDMKWAEFAELTGKERRLDSVGYAQPLPVNGRSSQTKIVQFQWHPGGEKLPIEEGDYDIIILGWTKISPKPQLTFKSFTTVTSEVVRNYQSALDSKQPLTLELPLGEDSEWNRTEQKNSIQSTYSVTF